MVFRRFRFICILRVALLTLTILGSVFLYPRQAPAAILLAIAAAYEAVSLVRYVERINRDLARFFLSVTYGDFGQRFTDEGLGPSFRELRTVMAGVMETLRKVRSEREEHAQYLQTVVQHVGIGLLVFQPNGDVDLINNAAKRLLRVPWLKNIQALATVSPELVETLLRLPPKEKGFVKVETEKEALTLALSATEFRLRGKDFRLVSLQNIQRELEEKEMEAWQKLIRVITHEIMNSVTPISTLASTIGGLADKDMQSGGGSGPEDEEVRTDIREAARTIEKRSQGLLHFVEAFRSLTLIPKPDMKPVLLKELFDRVGRLMNAHMTDRAVAYSASIEPETLLLQADPELIEQVLINLLLNALQAVEGRAGAAVSLKAFLNERGRILIQVADNGPGIAPENLEKVFVPFFSTKPGGSGIGLSLSRQILRLHRGTLHVHSEPNVQTVFTLGF
jgi:nitrogen fixation/metabolism regulation signal transduction histidine kinase